VPSQARVAPAALLPVDRYRRMLLVEEEVPLARGCAARFGGPILARAPAVADRLVGDRDTGLPWVSWASLGGLCVFAALVAPRPECCQVFACACLAAVATANWTRPIVLSQRIVSASREVGSAGVNASQTIDHESVQDQAPVLDRVDALHSLAAAIPEPLQEPADAKPGELLGGLTTQNEVTWSLISLSALLACRREAREQTPDERLWQPVAKWPKRMLRMMPPLVSALGVVRRGRLTSAVGCRHCGVVLSRVFVAALVEEGEPLVLQPSCFPVVAVLQMERVPVLVTASVLAEDARTLAVAVAAADEAPSMCYSGGPPRAQSREHCLPWASVKSLLFLLQL